MFIPTEQIDHLQMPSREHYPQLFRVLDKLKINETMTQKSEAKKDETMASFVEDVRQSVTKTLQKATFGLFRRLSQNQRLRRT